MVSRANHHHCCLFMLDTLHWWADLPRLRASSGPDLIGPQSLTPACVYAPLLVYTSASLDVSTRLKGWTSRQILWWVESKPAHTPGIATNVLFREKIGKMIPTRTFFVVTCWQQQSKSLLFNQEEGDIKKEVGNGCFSLAEQTYDCRISAWCSDVGTGKQSPVCDYDRKRCSLRRRNIMNILINLFAYWVCLCMAWNSVALVAAMYRLHKEHWEVSRV